MEIFTPILGMGMGIPIQVGTSLKEMLCDQLKIPPVYLERRIQTILVNGHAVDQVDRLQLSDGDVIALSAAMPGLAGAILRKGGLLSPMRAAISQIPSMDHGAADHNGVVTLKLFNMVGKEMGPQILAGGVWLRAGTWADIAPELPGAGKLQPDTRPDAWIAVSLTTRDDRV